MQQLSRRNVLCGLVGAPAGVASAAALMPFVPTGTIEATPDRYSLVIAWDGGAPAERAYSRDGGAPPHFVMFTSGLTRELRPMERGELKMYLPHPEGLKVGERIRVSAA